MFNRLASFQSRRKVKFQHRKMAKSESEHTNKDTSELFQNKNRIEELPPDDLEQGGASSKHIQHHTSRLPPWLKPETIHLFHDDFSTLSSQAQEKVTKECLPLLLGAKFPEFPLNSHGIPHLNREKHVEFLRNWLSDLPAAYEAMDASRPWLFYWSLAGLSFLGQDVSHYRERLIETLRPLQNPTGGFGGGHGQFSHCACTYASLLALAAVDGLDMVDRKAMWHFMGSVKRSDGGFSMAFGAEEDIRGAYCAMTAISLLNLPVELPPDASAREAGLETFLDGLGEWIGRCQTFEGGIAGAPTNESHGAYAFCALACLSILDAPHISVPKFLDVPALISCLAGIQTTPEGGFAGRANKLVDACYSHWVGGCWSILGATLAGASSSESHWQQSQDLWNREGLICYLLCCCQQPGKRGGMRDKPSARPDAYHTCYSLSGLSAAQNHYFYDAKGKTKDGTAQRLSAGFNWTASRATEQERRKWGFDESDVVELVHPIFVLPMGVVERVKRQFQDGGF